MGLAVQVLYSCMQRGRKMETNNQLVIIRKIEKYIEFLKTNTEFDTEFYDIGDGLSVSTWKHE